MQVSLLPLRTAWVSLAGGSRPKSARPARLDTRNRALGVDVHDQIPADDIQAVRDQAESEVGSAAAVSADLAEPQIARGNSKRRDDSRQDGAKRPLAFDRIVHPINIDACQIADDVARETVGRGCRARARQAAPPERSGYVTERVWLGNTLLGSRGASRRGLP